ncbi:hypothetical protein LSAT2_009668 [Lamellibrachia satsuma]|nr:hypothetical protein LSAT2_009668 [Lamellibrachia satsuma]
MKNVIALLAVVAMALVLSSVGAGGTSWYQMAECVGHKLDTRLLTNAAVRCAIGKMYSQYRKMQTVGCKNCDNECREISQQGTDSPDGREDMKANAYGRNGGNCYKRYGCAKKCAYKPSNGSCKKTNC